MDYGWSSVADDVIILTQYRLNVSQYRVRAACVPLSSLSGPCVTSWSCLIFQFLEVILEREIRENANLAT